MISWKLLQASCLRRFDGYNKLDIVKRCGCFAHVRRKFVDALPLDEAAIETSVSAVDVA